MIVIKTAKKVINILPLYLRTSTWNEDLEATRSFLINKDLENLVIIGDLNVRIGNLQQPLDEFFMSKFKAGLHTRTSQDAVINSKGKMFFEFCQDFGLHVINGCTKGDEIGNFTFVSAVGESVNDICALAHDNLELIETFMVDTKAWSDHMPIVLTLKVTGTNYENRMKLLPKLIWNERKKDEYRENLNQQLNIRKQHTTVLNLQEMTEVIQAANPICNNNRVQIKKDNKWFNFRCHNARKKSFNALNLYRQESTRINKDKYLLENEKYKEVCEESKVEYYNGLENKINSVKFDKDWWNILKEIKGTDFQHNTEIDAHVFQNYFFNLLNPPCISNDLVYAANFYSDDDLDRPINALEIRTVLTKAKYNKAPGEDRVSYEFFKNASDRFIEELTNAYNIIFETAKLDEKLITSIIFPIHKKGDRAIPSNYRGISFMNTIAKIFMGILNTRINLWLTKHNIITEYQAGFREGYSTVDNLYNLAAIASLKYKENKKLYAFFVDFKAAFDKVSRKSLFYKLQSIGMSTKMNRMIESIYGTTKFTVWNGENLSDEFYTGSGVKQGCLLSPTLFSIYLNDLHEHLGGGATVGPINIRLLMYADDIVILADDILKMQNMIHRLETYCKMWNLEVNLSKSEMMIFRKGGRVSNQEKWLFNGEPIRITNEYTYLGVTLSPKMSFKKHIEKRNISAKNCINATWKDFLTKKEIGLDAKWNLFKSVCRAIQSYGAQIWGFCLFDEVDKLQRYFLKKILRLPPFTPTYILLLETGIENNHIYTLDLHLRYIIKTLFDYKTNRLPNQLTKLIIEKEVYWYNDIKKLTRNVNTLCISECSTREHWECLRADIITGLNRIETELNREKATATERFYSNLNFREPQTYFEINNISAISYIFKARCDLLELNGTRFQHQRSRICSLCNLNEIENILHFIGKCPIHRHIRYRYFKKTTLTETELINILNDAKKYFNEIYRYVIDAIGYRKYLILEFNY